MTTLQMRVFLYKIAQLLVCLLERGHGLQEELKDHDTLARLSNMVETHVARFITYVLVLNIRASSSNLCMALSNPAT